MPRQAKIYKIFISFPSDMDAQRVVVEEAIRAYSRALEHRGVRLEPWSWNRDAVSEFGRPAQEAIDSQVDGYDIYLGLMGPRFGTPTGNFESGTEHEFLQAVAAKNAGNVLAVGFFFRNTRFAASALTAGDVEQLRKVIAFRDKIGAMGLYLEFDEDHQLSSRVGSFLSSAVENDLAGSVQHVGYQFPLHTGAGSKRAPTISSHFYGGVLNDLGADFHSGSRARLTLADLWVAPELRSISESHGSDSLTGERYTYESLIDDLGAGDGTIVMGNEKAGKSCLCRRVFCDLFQRGYLPVLLDGERINSTDIDRLVRRVRTAYAEQYDNLGALEIENIAKSQAVLVVDDFDRVKMSPKRAIEVLISSLAEFHAVLVTASPALQAGFLDSPRNVLQSEALKRVELRPIGHRRSYELIEKWCSAGQQQSSHEEDLRNLVERRRSDLDGIFRAMLVPRIPMMVLILLQAAEEGQAEGLARAGYVRYYKFLIDSAILRSSSPAEAELIYALAPELAWAAYQTRSSTLSLDGAERVVEALSEKRALRKSALYEVLSNLRRIGIFESREAAHRFRHRYVYYFFLADYMAHHLSEPEMRAEVVALCDRMDLQESADILTFLSFHTHDGIIVETLVARLASSFSGAKEFDFTTERTASINELIYEVPRQIIDSTKFKERRERRLDLEDRFAAENAASDRSVASELYIAMRAIEILGHVVRSHYARLESEPKRLILNASTGASLRFLGSLFDALAGSLDAAITAVLGFSDGALANESEAARSTTVKRAVFILVVALLIFVVSMVTRSIGDENLEVTYAQAFGGPSSRKVGKFIQLAIKLTHFRDFPMDDLKAVAGELAEDRVGLTALRYFVIERLDMRPPADRALLQRICDAAGIDLKSRLIERRESGPG